ncbi:hypothetical protein J4760_03785 [Salinicoccus sp. ID82-1]|uniref:hypothetical protein n=1 Tax=Salinicoccus sp. ID82-1 TaxID=2820269 RepID=UPI001F393B47|nr:hypothetical protein [Salinicoccus sp. ID82-1]MCG1009172.1 hypothetical protein [Salinicoccus sp. ID82-1]
MKMLLIILSILLYASSGYILRALLGFLSGMRHTRTDFIGLTIGYSERFLIIIFVLFDQYTAMGLIIAAKSILRFPSASDDEGHKESEYVLVGTMLSLVIGILNGLLFMYALAL